MSSDVELNFSLTKSKEHSYQKISEPESSTSPLAPLKRNRSSSCDLGSYKPSSSSESKHDSFILSLKDKMMGKQQKAFVIQQKLTEYENILRQCFSSSESN
jgi:hypothetical protein